MHDIVSVLLIVSGSKVSFSMIKQLVNTYFIYHFYINSILLTLLINFFNFFFFFFTDFSSSKSLNFDCLEIIYIIIHHYSPELYYYLKSIIDLPLFCISWVITWFSHDIYKFECVERLFDLFLSCHPFMIYYFISTVYICLFIYYFFFFSFYLFFVIIIK